MKISELIEELVRQKEMYGDVQVMGYNHWDDLVEPQVWFDNSGSKPHLRIES